MIPYISRGVLSRRTSDFLTFRVGMPPATPLQRQKTKERIHLLGCGFPLHKKLPPRQQQQLHTQELPCAQRRSTPLRRRPWRRPPSPEFLQEVVATTRLEIKPTDMIIDHVRSWDLGILMLGILSVQPSRCRRHPPAARDDDTGAALWWSTCSNSKSHPNSFLL